MTNIELTGTLTIQSIQQAASVFLTPINPTDFADVNQLYAILKNRGTLTLKDATLTLPINNEKFFIGAHKLILVNTKVYCNSTSTFILCNEYEHNTNSFINSFTSEFLSAKNGQNADSEGSSGKDGEHGLDGANVFCYVTDKVRTLGGTININLTGQNAGSGGKGMKGKKGEKGSTGRNCRDGNTPFDCGRGCGNGQTGKNGQQGGNGGDGGQGGDGGKFEFRFHGFSTPPDYFFTFSSSGGKGGLRGNFGIGGDGGDGGNAGSGSCRGCHGSCKPGADGKPGANGSIGQNGKNGDNNFLLNSNFDVNYLKLFISNWNNLLTDKSEVAFEFETGLTRK
jgi:hypothetical protein